MILSYALSGSLSAYVGVLLVLAVITSSIIAYRGPSNVLIGVVTVRTLVVRSDMLASDRQRTLHLSMLIVAIIIFEAILQLKSLARGLIRRLKAIAEFACHISSILDAQKVTALLSPAFQNPVEADTDFVGVRDDHHLQLEQCYDDGEYIENQRVRLVGSLSSWIPDNQRSLFLPDLRKEVELPGVRLVLLGKHKTSLSWLIVPMHGSSVDGKISIGAWRPNAFDRGRPELQNTLAQHAAQALDNTREHEQVEQRSKLNSLTKLLNNGNFLSLLADNLDHAVLEGHPLGQIMLYVDDFKRNNDRCAHPADDLVLVALSAATRRHA